MRLKPLRDQLSRPVLVINDSPIKQFAENEHAVGQSAVESFLRMTNRVTNGEQVTVFGYGACGRGVAASSRGHMVNLAAGELHRVDGPKVRPAGPLPGSGRPRQRRRQLLRRPGSRIHRRGRRPRLPGPQVPRLTRAGKGQPAVRTPGHAVILAAHDARVHREAASCGKILVERGLGVDLVHHSPPNPPTNPKQPRKSYDYRTGELNRMQERRTGLGGSRSGNPLGT